MKKRIFFETMSLRYLYSRSTNGIRFADIESSFRGHVERARTCIQFGRETYDTNDLSSGSTVTARSDSAVSSKTTARPAVSHAHTHFSPCAAFSASAGSIAHESSREASIYAMIRFTSYRWAVAGVVFAVLLIGYFSINRCHGQTPSSPQSHLDESLQAEVPGHAKTPEAPAVVEVQPVARDEEIGARLERILNATGWFKSPKVRVDEGVVFLTGRTDYDQHKTWASELAGNTRDVVAVVNKIDVAAPSPWNFQPALAGLRELSRSATYWIPYTLLALVILLIACGAAYLVSRGVRSALSKRIRVPLLQKVISRTVGFIVLLLGVYLVLRVCGLTRLALTVVGGTGLIGLVIGIAFRDITENFLASILLSVQAPFRKGDLIELAGVLGIRPAIKRPDDYLNVAFGTSHPASQFGGLQEHDPKLFEQSQSARGVHSWHRLRCADHSAQELALKVLEEHPAVLKSPEPWVLVDGLGPATVNLRVYFWLDGSQFSWLKVRSSVIRLIKRTFQEQNITMPDEVREVIFPNGVPVQMMQDSQTSVGTDGQKPDAQQRDSSEEEVSIEAEGGLGTEARQIEEQASQSRTPEEGENLLKSSR